MKAAGPVQSSERSLANLQVKDIEYVIGLGKTAGVKIMQDALAKIIAAWKRDASVKGPIEEAFADFEELLTDAMVYGHLRGMLQTATELETLEPLPIAAAASPVYSRGIQFLHKRIGMTDEQMDRLFGDASEYVKKIVPKASRMAQTKIQTAMAEIFAENLHVKGGIEVLKEAWAKAGLTPDNSFTIENTYRTQTMLAYSAGQANYERLPEIAELVWGYKYVTIGDDRVRDTHIALDGVTLKKDDPWWNTNKPPNGYACRCKIIRIRKPRKEVKPPGEVIIGEGDNARKVKPGADPGFEFDPGEIMTAGTPKFYPGHTKMKPRSAPQDLRKKKKKEATKEAKKPKKKEPAKPKKRRTREEIKGTMKRKPTRAEFDLMIQRQREERAARAQKREDFVKEHGETPFVAQVDTGTRYEKTVFVHRSTRSPGKWQVSYTTPVGKKGQKPLPAGHMEFKQYREALKELDIGFGKIDWKTVKTERQILEASKRRRRQGFMTSEAAMMLEVEKRLIKMQRKGPKKLKRLTPKQVKERIKKRDKFINDNEGSAWYGDTEKAGMVDFGWNYDKKEWHAYLYDIDKSLSHKDWEMLVLMVDQKHRIDLDSINVTSTAEEAKLPPPGHPDFGLTPEPEPDPRQWKPLKDKGLTTKQFNERYNVSLLGNEKTRDLMVPSIVEETEHIMKNFPKVRDHLYDDIMERYDLGGALNLEDTTELDDTPGYAGCYNTETEDIRVACRSYDNVKDIITIGKKKTVKLIGEDGNEIGERKVKYYTATAGLMGVYRHELGHHVHNRISGKAKRDWHRATAECRAKSKEKYVDEELANDTTYGGYARRMDAANKLMKDRISEYAIYNDDECLAEMFSVVTHPKHGLAQAARWRKTPGVSELMKWFDQYIMTTPEEFEEELDKELKEASLL